MPQGSFTNPQQRQDACHKVHNSKGTILPPHSMHSLRKPAATQGIWLDPVSQSSRLCREALVLRLFFLRRVAVETGKVTCHATPWRHGAEIEIANPQRWVETTRTAQGGKKTCRAELKPSPTKYCIRTDFGYCRRIKFSNKLGKVDLPRDGAKPVHILNC